MSGKRIRESSRKPSPRGKPARCQTRSVRKKPERNDHVAGGTHSPCEKRPKDIARAPRSTRCISRPHHNHTLEREKRSVTGRTRAAMPRSGDSATHDVPSRGSYKRHMSHRFLHSAHNTYSSCRHYTGLPQCRLQTFLLNSSPMQALPHTSEVRA